MVKIKDFTLASKNLGGRPRGMCLPCPTHLVTSRPWLAWNEGSIAYGILSNHLYQLSLNNTRISFCSKKRKISDYT